MISDKRAENIAIISIALAAIISILLMTIKYGENNKALYQADSQLTNISTNHSDVLPGIGTDYVSRIFDDSLVHVIDVQIDKANWDYMIKNAKAESYMLCDVIIDGERIENVAMRPKGNSSLSAIAMQESEHFSFKLEFDHFKAGNTYYGLDKLSLNNLGQDKSCMKDYLSYHMMNEMGVPGPLSSYTLLKINGSDLGLYLAVEAIDDSFCYRNYGQSYGELYRPDAFDIDSISPSDFMGIDFEKMFGDIPNSKRGERVDILGSIINLAFMDVQEQVSISAMNYAGDNPDTYNTIFSTSVFDIDMSDKKRFINAVKTLNTSDKPQDALDIDDVIDYFVVHNFVNNYDSYTGVFVHNFYVHEKDGRLAMVPWDYNLGFGAFSLESAVDSFFGGTAYETEIKLGEALTSEESFVNYPIDTPMYVVSEADRPMFGAWITNAAYREQYHRRYTDFFNSYFDSGKYAAEYAKLHEMLLPYVEGGLTFYTAEEFLAGAENVNLYCTLRCESIKGQIAGTIPSTLQGQEENYSTLIDTQALNLGSTISFEGVAFGITSAEVIELLDAVAGNRHEHNSAGVTESLAELSQNPSAIKELIPSVISNSSMIKRMLKLLVLPAFLVFTSVLAIIIANKILNRKYKKLNKRTG